MDVFFVNLITLIITGISSSGNTPNSTVFTSPTNRISVVLSSSGKVITVITK